MFLRMGIPENRKDSYYRFLLDRWGGGEQQSGRDPDAEKIVSRLQRIDFDPIKGMERDEAIKLVERDILALAGDSSVSTSDTTLSMTSLHIEEIQRKESSERSIKGNINRRQWEYENGRGHSHSYDDAENDDKKVEDRFERRLQSVIDRTIHQAFIRNTRRDDPPTGVDPLIKNKTQLMQTHRKQEPVKMGLEPISQKSTRRKEIQPEYAGIDPVSYTTPTGKQHQEPTGTVLLTGKLPSSGAFVPIPITQNYKPEPRQIEFDRRDDLSTDSSTEMELKMLHNQRREEAKELRSQPAERGAAEMDLSAFSSDNKFMAITKQNSKIEELEWLLRDAHGQKVAEAHTRSEQITSLKSKVRELEHRLSQDKEIDEEQTHKGRLRKQAQENAAILENKLQKVLTNVQTSMNQQDSQLSNIQSELNKALHQKDEEREASAKKSKIIQQQNAHIAELENSLMQLLPTANSAQKDYEKTMNDLRGEISELDIQLQKTYAQKKAEKEMSAKKSSVIAQQNTQISELEANIAELISSKTNKSDEQSKTILDLNLQIAMLHGQLREEQDARSTATKDSHSKSKIISDQKRQINELEKTARENDTLSDMVGQLEDSLSFQESELSRTKRLLAESKLKAEEHQTNWLAIAHQKEQVIALQGRLKDTQQQLEAFSGQENIIAKQNIELRKLKSQIDKDQSLRDISKNTINEQRSQIGELTKQLDDAHRKAENLEKYKRLISQQQVDIRKMKNELEQASGAYQDANEKTKTITQLNAQLSKLHEQVEKAGSKSSASDLASLSQQRARIADLTSQIKIHRSECSEKSKTIEHQQTEMANLKKKLDDALSKTSDQSQSTTKLRARILDLEKTLRRNNLRRSDTNLVEEKSKEIDKLRAQVSEMKDRLRQAEAVSLTSSRKLKAEKNQGSQQNESKLVTSLKTEISELKLKLEATHSNGNNSSGSQFSGDDSRRKLFHRQNSKGSKRLVEGAGSRITELEQQLQEAKDDVQNWKDNYRRLNRKIRLLNKAIPESDRIKS